MLDIYSIFEIVAYLVARIGEQKISYDGWKEWTKSNKLSRHSSHSLFNCPEIFNFIKLTSAYKVYFHVPLLNQSHKALTFLSFHHVAVFSILTQLFRLLERFFASSIIYYLWNMEIQIDFKFSKIMVRSSYLWYTFHRPKLIEVLTMHLPK